MTSRLSFLFVLSRLSFLFGLAVAMPGVSAGCAARAQKTPTPAAQINGEELARRPPPPDEHYYLIMFGSQNWLKQPRYTHTWGTLVHTKKVAGKEELEVDEITISWLPTDLTVRPLKLRVEPGTNLGMHETIKYVKENREHIDMWGPYEVWHGFAYRFKIQKEFLDSGVVGYQCTDTIGEAARKGNGCDCIHSISDLDPAYSRERYPLIYFGVSATENLLDRIMKSPVTIDGQTTHDWLLPRLGLCCDDINRRTYTGHIEPYVPGYQMGLEQGPGAKEPAPKLPLPVPKK